MIVRKSRHEIEKMAAAGALVADTIAHVGEHIRPGVTTAELDRIGEDYIRSRGGVPTSKGYRGFPAALCLSPNDMIVHGIPGPYRLDEGDLISVDVGVTIDGFVADAAYTFPVGDVSEEAERRVRSHRLAQDVSGRDVRQPVLGRDPLRLRPLPSPLGTQDQEVHLALLAGCGSRRAKPGSAAAWRCWPRERLRGRAPCTVSPALAQPAAPQKREDTAT